MEVGATIGCYNLIKDRCITGIPLDKRPFHCVDSSRRKYMLRKNDDWLIDHMGSMILEGAYPQIRNVLMTDPNETNIDVQNRNMSQLFDMHLNGKKKIISQLNKDTFIKNNIKN